MFRDLKEYQEIQNLYTNSVYLSEEEKKFIEVVKEAELTDEELQYFSENTEEVINYLIESELLDEKLKGLFKLGGLVKGLTKTKNVKPIVSPLKNLGKTKIEKPLFKKNLFQKLVAPFQKFKPSSQVKPLLKKGLTAGAVGAGIGAGIEAFKNVKKSEEAKNKAIEDAKIKAEKDKKIDQQVDDYVNKNKGDKPINKDLTIDKSEEGKKKYAEKASERKAENEKKEEKPKPQTEVDKIAATPRSEIKKSGRTAMIKKNIDRFGKDRVQMLQDKNKDFQAMKKGKMTKDEFIKKYPKSITAQRAKGLRDQTEWDAYDMVLEYLYSTEQVASLEEANYVMMEMDQQTIGSIVKEVSGFLEEGIGQLRVLPTLGKALAGAALVKGVSSYLGNRAGKNSIQTGGDAPDKPMDSINKKRKEDVKPSPKPSLIQKIKNRTDATNKAIEAM